jgi:phosphatidylserine/phosphatidylglycerophosphate/cardiolipin synthase-like enzyme
MISYHSLIVQPVDGRIPVLNALKAAKKSIGLTIYEISDPQIMSALQAARARGVAVRVLYDWYSFPADMQQREITPAIQELTKAGILCKQAPRTFEVTHEKAFVIDGATALVMSFNLTSEYFGQTRDFGIVTTEKPEVTEISNVFEADWNDKPVTPQVASLVWSPVNSRSKLTSLISGSSNTLDIYCEEVDDPGTLGAMVEAAKRGVKVRFIAAVLSGEGKVNGNARGITYLQSGGVNAVCKSFLYIHAKMVLADFGKATARAYIGSENFSCVSLDDNRECGIIVSESEILARLQSTYNSDWAQPSVAVTPDHTPINACQGDPASRAQARRAARA